MMRMKMRFEAGRNRWDRPAQRDLALTRSRVARRISQALNALEGFKNRMLEELTSSLNSTELVQRLRRAADESASLAWATPYPLLFLPELITEKANEAQRQFERQKRIQSQDRNSISMAV